MKVSLIVPVYGVEKYIAQCLDSIVAQTYKNLEIILVDDGTKDNSIAIAHNYANELNMQIIHQANQGLSAARNTGINAVSGDFICFVDSDDILHPQYVETMVAAAKQYPGYLPIVMMQRFETHPPPFQMNNIKDLPSKLYNQPQAIEGLYQKKTLTVFTIACSKLYSSELWKTLRFPVGKVHEDVATVLDIFTQVKGVCFIDEPLYFYRDNPSSITSSFNIKRFDSVDAYLHHVRLLVARNDVHHASQAALALLKTVLGYASQIESFQALSSKERGIVRRSLYFGSRAAWAIRLKDCTFKDNLFTLVYRYSPKLAIRLYGFALSIKRQISK